MSSDLAMPITKHVGLKQVRTKRKCYMSVYLAPVDKTNSLFVSQCMSELMIFNETRYTTINTVSRMISQYLFSN